MCLNIIISRNRGTPYLDRAVFASGLQSQNAQRLGYNHSLLPIVWWGDSLEELESLKGSSTPGALVWGHAADGPVEDLGGGTVMEWARLFGVDDVPLVEEIVVTELCVPPFRLNIGCFIPD